MKSTIKFTHKVIELSALTLIAINLCAFAFGMATIVITVVQDYVL